MAADDDAEVRASALLTSAWISIEQRQFARVLEKVRAAETALATRTNHSLLMLADLMGGIADLRAGNIGNAVARLAAKRRVTRAGSAEENWMPARRRVALAQGRYNASVTSFARLSRCQDGSGAMTQAVRDNLPARAGGARRDARGNRAEAIRAYRPGRGGNRSAHVAELEPRHVFELARCWTRTAINPAPASSTGAS